MPGKAPGIERGIAEYYLLIGKQHSRSGAAGAYGSPAMLMRSGIGPADHIAERCAEWLCR